MSRNREILSIEHHHQNPRESTRFKVLHAVSISTGLFCVVSKVLTKIMKEPTASTFRKEGKQKAPVTTYKTTGYHEPENHTYKSVM
jgi:hypothetical protein